jgi:hypothetical protein
MRIMASGAGSSINLRQNKRQRHYTLVLPHVFRGGGPHLNGEHLTATRDRGKPSEEIQERAI